MAIRTTCKDERTASLSFGNAPSSGNFVVNAEDCLAQVFNSIFFQVTAPDVFHGISKIESHVASNFDALDSRWVRCIVRRGVDEVNGFRA